MRTIRNLIILLAITIASPIIVAYAQGARAFRAARFHWSRVSVPGGNGEKISEREFETNGTIVRMMRL